MRRSDLDRPDAKRLGAEVRRRRVEQMLTHATLAERAGVSPLTIGDLERGTSDTALSTIEKVANGLGIEVGALLPRRRGLSAAGVEFATLFDEVKDRKVQAAMITILRALPRRKGRRT